jgi:hypothetical protein
MTREFVTPLVCPECGQTGTAAWEETEGLDKTTTPKSVSTGFRISGHEVLCIDCGIEAVAVSDRTPHWGQREAEEGGALGDWSDEETDSSPLADDRDFLMVEKRGL